MGRRRERRREVRLGEGRERKNDGRGIGREVMLGGWEEEDEEEREMQGSERKNDRRGIGEEDRFRGWEEERNGEELR